MTDERPIGIFDSGVGGLTVMRAVTELLPAEQLVYLGDTARVPYGNRSPETVQRYATNATSMLVSQGVKALVIACNTASAYALTSLRARYPLPVIGVVDPVARRAASATKSGAVGVLGTRGTIASGCYQEKLAALGVARVVQQPCPLFVPLAEEGWVAGPVVEEIARTYLAVFADTDVDTLILGCTHYPLLAAVIEQVFEEIAGRPVQVLDSATATARSVADELDRRAMRAGGDQGRLRFCATDDPSQFATSASRFFGSSLNDVEHVDIRDVSHDEVPR